MRVISRPPTARCTLAIYVSFLLSEPHSPTGCRLAEVMEVSHDSVNRFLLREDYTPQDLFNEVRSSLNLKGGTVSVDDSVLDKPYSQLTDLIGYFWSGKHHGVVKGINLITLYYTDPQGHHQPINYRIYDKTANKTKNDYFQEMFADVLAWGLEPAFVTGDSWYSSGANLKMIKNHHQGFLFALESNRLVSLEKGQWLQVQQAVIPDDGLLGYLRGFGTVKVFRTWLKNQPRHYALYQPNDEGWAAFERPAFLKRHDQHWQIEQYHRTLKQVCHIEHFQVRQPTAIRNHLFAAICGYVHLQQLRAAKVIHNCYRLQRELFNEVIAAFIQAFTPNLEHLNPQFQPPINA
jgi:hypothetical protein